MTSVLNSLMSGGYTQGNYTAEDAEKDFELWLKEKESEAFNMSDSDVEDAYFDACMDGDETLKEIYEREMNNRKPVIDVPTYSTLADEPMGLDDPEHEDRRKDYLENYCPVEQDELPF